MGTLKRQFPRLSFFSQIPRDRHLRLLRHPPRDRHLRLLRHPPRDRHLRLLRQPPSRDRHLWPSKSSVRGFGYDYDYGYGYVKSVDSMDNVNSVRSADNVNRGDELPRCWHC